MESFIILFLSVLSALTFTKVDAALPFKEQCVKWHNEFRAKHQVGQVTWNDDLAKGAEDWAKYLAANNLFQHAPNLNVGENLYWSSHKPEEPCTKATKAFYGEVKYYDYDKPRFSLKTGHFTQIVWKNTKQIGAAQATRRDGSFVLVIRYSPPGNFVGEKAFRANVLPVRKGNPTSSPGSTGAPPTARGGGPCSKNFHLGLKALVGITLAAMTLWS